nr:MAG TPA: hypothetical protein [Caudoviricetes sp.]
MYKRKRYFYIISSLKPRGGVLSFSPPYFSRINDVSNKRN